MKAEAFLQQIARTGVTLTEQQRAAVLHDSGPLLVFAGPGSGKTTMLTLRALALARVSGVPPSHLALVTFTKKSAQELRQRLVQLDALLGACQVGTFHSLYLRWLIEFRTSAIRILSAGEQQSLLREAFARTARGAHAQRLLTAQRIYADLKARRGVWDYDDILSEFHALLLNQPEALAEIRRRSAFWMVDEFQDTNPVQWSTVSLLCQQSRNLAVVGDDDQAIYSFRGASPQSMLTFCQAFPDAREIFLAQNFRSTDAIVFASQHLIEQNAVRRDKRMQPMRGAGAAVKLSEFASEKNEADAVVQWLDQRAQKASETWCAAILARTHGQLFLVMEALTRRGIPYTVQSDGVTLWEHPTMRTIRWLAELSLLLEHGSTDQQWRALQAWLGVPDESELNACYPRATSLLQRLQWLEQERPDNQRIASIRHLLPTLAAVPPLEALLALWRLLSEQGKFSSPDYTEEQAALLQALTKSAVEYGSLRAWLEATDVSRRQQQRRRRSFLSILTLHGAKGLEFDDVIIVGLHDDACPHPRSLAQSVYADPAEAIAEERRLLYVGMTRARNRLDLTYATSVKGSVRMLSPFLVHLLPAGSKQLVTGLSSAQSARVGDVCVHEQWGQGVVQSARTIRPGVTQVSVHFAQGRPLELYWEHAMQAGVLRLVEPSANTQFGN